jgi:omega-6 fatty acid desaturase (delta-12 desaturase)
MELGSTEHRTTTYKHVARFAKANYVDSFSILFQTLFLHFSLLYLNWWVLLPLHVLNKFKTFILYHDMAHLSYFPRNWLNRTIGTLVGAMVTMPRVNWSEVHNYHHQHTNLTDDSAAMFKQTAPLTVKEFKALSTRNRWLYMFFYGDFTVYTSTPVFDFYIGRRFSSNLFENIAFYSYYLMLWYTQRLSFEFVGMSIGTMIGMIFFHLVSSIPTRLTHSNTPLIAVFG